jgi:arginase family enzyme
LVFRATVLVFFMLLFGVPSEQGSLGRNRGCALAPARVLEGKAFETVQVVPNNFAETDRRIFKRAEGIFCRGERALFVGGDHSISFALVKAFSQSFGGKKALVVFDAHPDCVQFFEPLSHEDWIQGVVAGGLVEAESIALVGVRKVHALEKRFLEKTGIGVLGAGEVKSHLQAARCRLLGMAIDVFDPAIAPGTGCPEKNGLLEAEFFALLGPLLDSGKVKAIELVEANPLKDNGRTIALGRRIVERLLECPR